MSWKIKDFIEPAFDGALLDNSVVLGGIFVVRTLTQRNNIKLGYRKLNSTSTTLCLVADTNQLYKLINEPNTQFTTNSDWALISLGVTGSLTPVGEWDPVINAPALTDAGALNRNGEFYFVINAGSGFLFQDPNLFINQAVTVYNGDWIVSIGERWTVLRPTVTWDMLVKPQSIVDYVNGIVIEHQHVIGDIDDLQAALDEKLDENDVAASDADIQLVDENLLVNIGLIKAQIYTKPQVDELLGEFVSAPLFVSDINVVLSEGKSLGGYVNGDVIPAIGKNANQVLIDLATEYLKPSFPSFSITGQSTIIEVGAALSGTKIFTWTMNNASNLQAGTIQIRDITNNVLIATGLSNGGTAVVNIGTITNSDEILHQWRIEAVNTKGEGFQSAPFSVRSIYPVFSGKVSAPGEAGTGRPAIAQGLLTSATKSIVDSSSDVSVSFLSTPNDYCFVAIPASSPLKTKWKVTEYNTDDIGGAVGAGGNLFPSPVAITVASPSSLWNNVLYNFYLTNYQTEVEIIKFTNN